MIKKSIFAVYLVVWLLLAAFSIAKYSAIWQKECHFQTVGWLVCTANLSVGTRIGLIAFIIFLFGYFLVVGRLWWKRQEVELLPRTAIWWLLGIGCLAVLVAPLGTSDLPYYFSAGKALNQNVNPYVDNWIHQVDYSEPVIYNPLVGFSYGPLIAAAFHGLYNLVQGQVALFFLVWKFFMLITLAGCAWLTTKLITLLSGRQNTAWYVLLFAQPMLLFEWVVNGHFDGLWLFFILLAIYAAHTKRWWLMLPALTVGIWIKYIPLLLLPFFGLWWWQDMGREIWKKNGLRMGLGVVISTAITFFSWQPYWIGSAVFSSLVLQSKWAVTSVFAVFYYSLKPLFQFLFVDRAHLVLTSLTQGTLVLAVLYMLYPLIKKCLAILFKKARWESGEYVQAMLIFLLVYLIVWQKSFWPWYGTWFISLGLIVYETYRHAISFKIISWLATVPFLHHIILLSDALAKDPRAGSQLWFYYVIVGIVLAYPLYLLIRWRQKNYAIQS